MQLHKASVESWDENNLKRYNLVLKHCLKELEVELLNQGKCAGVEVETNVVLKAPHPYQELPV